MENETSVYVYVWKKRWIEKRRCKKGMIGYHRKRRERERQVMTLQEIYGKKRERDVVRDRWERLEASVSIGKEKRKKGKGKKDSVRKEWQAIRGLKSRVERHEDSPVTRINTSSWPPFTPLPSSWILEHPNCSFSSVTRLIEIPWIDRPRPTPLCGSTVPKSTEWLLVFDDRDVASLPYIYVYMYVYMCVYIRSSKCIFPTELAKVAGDNSFFPLLISIVSASNVSRRIGNSSRSLINLLDY